MVRIREPFHGAVLNHRHGTQSAGALAVHVRGEAPPGHRVAVNGIEARRAADAFDAVVEIRDREADITARAEGVTGTSSHTVRVVWDRHSRPRYRFSIDDNSFFARDVAASRPGSLFDCFYLGILRDLHGEYGAKFVLNLFFTTPEHDFDLSRFPEDYKSEWRDNADWLKLSFHARCEFPNRPYQYAASQQLAEDFDTVANEIMRFAGEEAWSTPTVIHWGMLPRRSLPVLTERGVKVLSGMFGPAEGSSYTSDGEEGTALANGVGYDVNYLLDETRSEYLSHHDALMDFGSGIVFSRGDIVCNNVAPNRVVSVLSPLAHDPNNAEIMDLFTHEQYFWPFYHNHRPDHKERCETAIRFCTENGYEPVFFHEGFLGVEE